MFSVKYKVEVHLTREEYQLLCRALVKVEAEIRGADQKEVLFWNEESAESLANIRAGLREAFTRAFGGNRVSDDHLPPASDRGVTFLSSPPEPKTFLPPCCRLREKLHLLGEAMEEARLRSDSVMYSSNLNDWRNLYDQWLLDHWCDNCGAEWRRVNDVG